MFCKKCGKEVAEDAYLCVGCGCLLTEEANQVLQQVVVKTEKTPLKGDFMNNGFPTEESVEKNKMLLLKIFLFISFGCACLSLFFAFLHGTTIDVDYYLSDSLFLIWCYWGSFPGCATLISALLGLGLAVTAFVFSLRKNAEELFKMISIFNIIANAIFAVVGIFLISA